MVSLIIATISAAMFSILFKYFQRNGIDSFKAILVNYIVAFAWGYALSMRETGFSVNPIKEKWFILAVLIGIVFIRGMVLLNICTEKVGVAISTVCSRASMIIPIIFCYLFIPGSDIPNWFAIIVVILSLVLIVSTDMRSVVHGVGKKSRVILLTTVVFLIFGASNSMLKLMQYMMSQIYGCQGEDTVTSMNAIGTSVIFLVAFVIAVITEIIKYLTSKSSSSERKHFTWKELVGGVVLGSANFFCTYLLVIAMRKLDPAVLFPIHNAGIVALGAIAGWVFFGEKLTKTQIVGIFVSMAAIVWLCM